MILRKWFLERNFFWNSFSEKFQILNHFLYNGSDLESTILNVSDMSQLFAARQFLQQNFKNVLKFEIKFFFKITVSDDNFAFEKPQFWSSYTIQTPFCGVVIVLKKEGSEKKNWKQFQNQKFYCWSDFEPTFLYCVIFLIQNFQTCQT